MLKLRFKRKYLSIPYFIFLICFVLLPLLLIIYYALSNENGTISLDNFVKFFSNKNKIGLLSVSIIIGALNTALCILIGYPVAMLLTKNKKGNNKISIMILLFIMPMWINFVLRTAATRDLLYWIGIDGGNYPYLATMIGMVYNYLPFTILPLYSQMLKMDKSLIEASYDLGANKFKTFIKTQIPLTMPGIISGAMMVFMPTMSSFVISDVMGERQFALIGNIIQTYFDQAMWHLGSFFALTMLVIILVSMFLTRNVEKEYLMLRIMTFFRYFGDCLFYGYFYLFLESRELTESTIGMICAITPLIALISNPFWNYISKNANTNRKIMAVITVLEGIFILLFTQVSIIELLALLTCLTSFVGSPFYSLHDGFTATFAKIYEKDYSIAFSFVLRAGSDGLF